VSKQTFRSYAGEGGEAQGQPTLLHSPTLGKVTQRYWFCHNGWDIANPEGTPVLAVVTRAMAIWWSLTTAATRPSMPISEIPRP
jgi:hypothetical protein